MKDYIELFTINDEQITISVTSIATIKKLKDGGTLIVLKERDFDQVNFQIQTPIRYEQVRYLISESAKDD